MGKYFGTDGFRGEANKDLTVEHAFKIGRYLGWFYGKDHKAKVVIGKDASVLGFPERMQVRLVKLLPVKMVMNTWCRQQGKK